VHEAVLGTRRTTGGDHDDLVVERALVERARTDRAAFALLYRNHVSAVYAFAYRRCGSREVAEEATSATFERALRAIEGYEWRGAGFRPWLLRIASNEVAEVYRNRSRPGGTRGQLAMRAMATPDALPGDEDGDLAGAEPGRGVDLAEMHAALDRLPERYRAAISLRYLAGMSASDAAAELGCSNPVLAVTLHRALKALRAEMSDRRTNGGER
jgi:RNA polymerase sigma-70 factor (ECF subfamily)